MRWLSERTDELPIVKSVSDKVGLPPVALAGLWLFWAVSTLLAGLGGELLCVRILLGQVFPLYASFRAVEAGERACVRNWLKYWAVLAALVLTDTALRPFLRLPPFCGYLRLWPISWLFLPAVAGACLAYDFVMARALRARETVPGAVFGLVLGGDEPGDHGAALAAATEELEESSWAGMERIAALSVASTAGASSRGVAGSSTGPLTGNAGYAAGSAEGWQAQDAPAGLRRGRLGRGGAARRGSRAATPPPRGRGRPLQP